MDGDMFSGLIKALVFGGILVGLAIGVLIVALVWWLS